MSVTLYFDEHVKGQIYHALRARHVDVITAQGDGMTGSKDQMLLDRANGLGRVTVSQDPDFLIESARRQRAGEDFAGIIFAQQKVTIRHCIEELELIAFCCEPAEFRNKVVYLPI